jgi:hypothetical protein
MFSKLKETTVAFCSSVSNFNGNPKHILLQALIKVYSVEGKFCHADRQGVGGNLCHSVFANVCRTHIDLVVCCDLTSISFNNLFRDDNIKYYNKIKLKLIFLLDGKMCFRAHSDLMASMKW